MELFKIEILNYEIEIFFFFYKPLDIIERGQKKKNLQKTSKSPMNDGGKRCYFVQTRRLITCYLGVAHKLAEPILAQTKKQAAT